MKIKDNITSSKNGTVIEACTCKHLYQDSQYGQGKRVKNLTVKTKGARCTVCSKVTNY